MEYIDRTKDELIDEIRFLKRQLAAKIITSKESEEEIVALAKFPSENPNPVLRIARDGEVLYSNKAGLELLEHWGVKIKEKAPGKWRRLIKDMLESAKPGSQEEEEEEEEEEAKGKIFSVRISPVLEAGYVNLYCRDISKQRKMEEEAKKRVQELEVFYKASIGKEERILELKKEIEQLKKELGNK